MGRGRHTVWHSVTHLVSELKVKLVTALLIGKALNVLVFLRGQASCAGNFYFYSISENIHTGPKGNFISASIDFLYTQGPRLISN